MTVVLGSFAATAVLTAIALAMSARRYMTVTIEGNSMAPMLLDGQRVVARRARGRRCRKGDVIVFRAQERIDTLAVRVKRIVAAPGDPTPAWMRETAAGIPPYVPRAAYVVRGDGSRSEDSRQLGFVHYKDVIAIVSSPPDRGRGRSTSSGRRSREMRRA